MTTQSKFKRKVRARMAKTGESYTAARRQLIERGETPPGGPRAVEPRVSAGAVRAATGRTWDEWFAILDRWEATQRTHAEIARWLGAEQGVSGWWAQGVTVAYEQARGMRAPGQRPDGWEVSASKTVAVPLERLFEAFTDEERRERWLPGADMSLRTATAPKSARYDWEDGSTRVVAGFEAKGEAKSQVAIAHQRLPDAETAEAMKAYWRERVQALKEEVEG
jgi:hypothetical protein